MLREEVNREEGLPNFFWVSPIAVALRNDCGRLIVEGWRLTASQNLEIRAGIRLPFGSTLRSAVKREFDIN
jgi:hypothetical protein